MALLCSICPFESRLIPTVMKDLQMNSLFLWAFFLNRFCIQAFLACFYYALSISVEILGQPGYLVACDIPRRPPRNSECIVSPSTTSKQSSFPLLLLLFHLQLDHIIFHTFGHLSLPKFFQGFHWHSKVSICTCNTSVV